MATTTKRVAQRVRRQSGSTRKAPGIQLAPSAQEPPVPAIVAARGIEATATGYTVIETQTEVTDWRDYAAGIMRHATLSFNAQTTTALDGSAVDGTGYLGVEFTTHPAHMNGDAEGVTTSARIDIQQIRAEDVEVLAAGLAALAAQMRQDGVIATLAAARRAE